MATEKNKWVEAIGRLLKLTQDRQLIWKSSEPPEHLKSQPDRHVDVVYQANYKDNILRLYELTYKVEEPDPSTSVTVSSVWNWKRKYPYWVSTTVLDLVDYKGLGTWRFPYTEASSHLLNAVKYQVAGVEGFLSEILIEA